MVSFSTILVHECQLRVGDAPLVSCGVPVALGAKLGERIVDVDHYERVRRYQRRHGSALLIKKKDRVDRLLAVGFSPEEIYQAALEASIERKRILESRTVQHWDKFNERLELTTRKFSKILRVRKESQNKALYEYPKVPATIPPTQRSKTPSAA